MRDQLVKNPKLAVSARKQRYAGLREKCCGTRLRGSAPKTPAGGSASCTSTFLTLCACKEISLQAFSFRTQSRHGHMVTVKGARKERTSHSFPCGQTLKEACSCLSILTKMTKQPQYLKLFSFSYFRQHALATFWQPDRKERWRGGRGFSRSPARRCRRYVYRY